MVPKGASNIRIFLFSCPAGSLRASSPQCSSSSSFPRDPPRATSRPTACPLSGKPVTRPLPGVRLVAAVAPGIPIGRHRGLQRNLQTIRGHGTPSRPCPRPRPAGTKTSGKWHRGWTLSGRLWSAAARGRIFGVHRRDGAGRGCGMRCKEASGRQGQMSPFGASGPES